MTSILTDCAKDIVGRVINLIIDESRNVCCFKCIVDDFEKEKPELEAKWRSISKDIEDAERRAEDILEDVTHWQVEAKKLIDEDTKTKVSCFGGWCPNCIWRYKRGKQLTQITNDVRTLKAFNFQSVGRPPHLPDVEIHSSQGFIPFESRDSEYKQLLDAIADENNYITGLQGMGGAGKTTLAKEVGRKLEESGKFDSVVFATVSNNPDIKKIQDSIAGPLGLSLKDMDEWTRRSTILKRLTDGKNILIILDDVWEQINFGEIGIPSGDSHKNCRVLLTSRDVRVCKSMGCSRPTQLALLSDQDAWILFKKHSGIDDSFPKSFQDKGQEITKECKNLPVAIAAIASSLKKLPIEEWDAALTALQNPTHMLDYDENLTTIYNVLSYSYDNMKNDKAKRLFLLLSVFPKNYVIHTEFLTAIGIGAGLFGEVERYSEARNQLLRIRTKLIDSCLWLETEDRYLTFHDFVREMARWKAKGDIQSLQVSEENRKAWDEKEKKVKYLCCNDLEVRDMDVFPRWFDASELVILFIYMEVSDSVIVSHAFFEKMTRLRVLDLTNNALSKFSLMLPDPPQSLSNIRCLALSNWKLGDLSILGILQKLESLDFYDCSINELPNEITKLEKLRQLKLEDCEIERNNPFEVIGRCLQLEFLYFNHNELSLLDTANEVEAIHQNTTFPKLKRYHLDQNDEMDALISKIVCLPKLDALISEATFRDLMQGAEIIQLEGIERKWRNLIPEIVPMEDNCMNDLIELSLKSCSEVKCLVNTEKSHSRVPNVFSKLVELNLKSMDKLEELCIGLLPSEFLKSLQRLHIEECEYLQGRLFKRKLNLCNLKIMKLIGCPKLGSLFQPSTARTLVQLEELSLCKCKQLTNIITSEASKDQDEEILDGNKGYDTMFAKLKILQIEFCDQLEDLPLEFLKSLERLHLNWCEKWEGMLFKGKLNLCNLKIMEVVDCPMLTSLFQPSTARSLVQLEELSLCKCKQLTHIITDEGSKNQEKEEGLYGDKDHKDYDSMFPKLKILEIEKCDRLERILSVLFPQDIPLLETIKIVDCAELKHMFGRYQHNQDSVLGSLRKMELSGLSSFVSICVEFYPPKSSSSMKRSSSRHCSKTKQQDPSYQNIFSWSCICCYCSKNGSNLRSATSHKMPVVSQIPNSSRHFVESAQCVPKQPQGLNVPIIRNTRVIELKGFDKIKWLFNLSIASSMMMEILRIETCHGMKHIIDIGDDCDGKNYDAIFPNLKDLSVYDCGQLEYMFDQYPLDHQNSKMTNIHLPALQKIDLRSLPNFTSICPKNSLSNTLPSLKEVSTDGCPLFAVTFLNELVPESDTTQLDHTITKDVSGIEKHFLTLESLRIKDVKIESMFHVDGLQIIELPLCIALKYLKLDNLPQMTCICVASKNSFTFQHLQTLQIVGCAKLELIFPICVLRFLPELKYLEIVECKELKQIIEEDVENQKLSPQPCFPKLATFIVRQCHKLKCLFASNDLPNLQFLIINEASELEELIGCEQKQGNDGTRRVEVMFPKLKAVIFMDLSSLSLGAETLQTTRHRVVLNCPKLSLTSTTSLQTFRTEVLYGDLRDLQIDEFSMHDMREILYRATKEVTPDYLLEPETQRASASKLPSSQTNEESEEEFVGKVASSEIPAATTSLTDSKSELIERPSSSPLDITPCKTHSQINEATVKECVQDWSNLTDKEGEIGAVFLDNIIVTQPNEEEPKKEFIGRVSISEMPAIAASPTDSDMIKGSFPSLSNIPLPQIHSNSIKRGDAGEATSENGKMETLSPHLKPVISQPEPLVTPQHQPYPHSEIGLSQTETYINKENEGHPDPINIQDLRDDDLINLFQPEEEDNLVVKVLADLEECLKMPLKDIASCEANSLRLLTALNFLSRLSLEHVTLSDGFKVIIHSLHKEFPSILCSFKQAFATTDKFAVLEEKEKSIKEELAKISKAKYFMDEAQQKEAMLKERMNRLEKEMKDCEADLSSLQEKKKKFVAETMGYKKEFETLRNEKSQMMEDQRKARQKLFEADYKWSVLCSQFENSRITANNSS